MKSFARPSFWRAYDRLDDRTREAARKAYRLFEKSPDHPSLQFKKLGSYDRVWSVRISDRYRAVGRTPWRHDFVGMDRYAQRVRQTLQINIALARIPQSAIRIPQFSSSFFSANGRIDLLAPAPFDLSA